MIPYKAPRSGRPSPRGGIAKNQNRRVKKEMSRNSELAESLQGLALLQTLKNVVLVDISEYTQPHAQDPASP